MANERFPLASISQEALAVEAVKRPIQIAGGSVKTRTSIAGTLLIFDLAHRPIKSCIKDTTVSSIYKYT